MSDSDGAGELVVADTGLIALVERGRWLEEGCRALARARSIQDVLEIRDQLGALHQYASHRRLSVGGLNDIAEMKVRAERRIGQLLKEVGLERGRPKKRLPGDTFFRLADAGLSKVDSSRFQRLASIPADDFEGHIAEAREAGERLTTRDLLQLAKQLQQPGKAGAPILAGGCTVADLQTLVDNGEVFGCIYADPPWKYGNQGTRAATDNHYPTMTVDEIAELPVKKLAADYCHLHLWTTNAFLFECQRLFDAWGFKYQGLFFWAKPQIGIGNCYRVSHEILFLAIKGEPRKFKDHTLRSWAEIDRTSEHSAKPEQVRLMIEKASPAPYLELFGRKAVPNWTVWGNEIERDLFTKGIPNLEKTDGAEGSGREE